MPRFSEWLTFSNDAFAFVSVPFVRFARVPALFLRWIIIKGGVPPRNNQWILTDIPSVRLSCSAASASRLFSITHHLKCFIIGMDSISHWLGKMESTSPSGRTGHLKLDGPLILVQL
jgi:hypothetical protein